MSILQTKDLTKVYTGGIRAVDGINFEVEEGEIFGFLGPNGAGKTTTIKMLNTLIPPTSGTATVAGFDVVKNPAEVRKRIGYTAQNVGVDERATGKENLTLYGHFYRLNTKTIRQRLKDLFELVELTGAEDQMVSTYSGGMRKRLDLAMGLIHQPRLIFLDEPTTGLDPQTRASIWDHIRNLAKTMGVTIFLTTHYLDEADKLADRVAIIDHGKIMTIGTPKELKHTVGGDVVTISSDEEGSEASADFQQKARKALSGKDFVQQIQESNGSLAIIVASGESAVPKIMRDLGAEGVEVQTLTVSHPSLDDVFLKYTGRTIRAQEGTQTTFTQMRLRSNRRS